MHLVTPVSPAPSFASQTPAFQAQYYPMPIPQFPGPSGGSYSYSHFSGTPCQDCFASRFGEKKIVAAPATPPPSSGKPAIDTRSTAKLDANSF